MKKGKSKVGKKRKVFGMNVVNENSWKEALLENTDGTAMRQRDGNAAGPAADDLMLGDF